MQWKRALVGGVVLAAGATAAVLAFGTPPGWLTVLLATITLAGLYIVVRRNSRYDPLDPRFGSCIPPPPGFGKPRGDT